MNTIINKPQLFLLHYAGGNYYSFRFLEPYLQDLECVPLELPGRGKRIYEAHLKDLGDAAEMLAGQIFDRLDSSEFLIYGHSMGAMLALLVAGILERNNICPSYLIVTGNAGPGVRELEKKHLLDKEAFKKELMKLGGIPDELYQNDELYNFFEPIIRADFELVETGNHIEFPPVKAPIYAMMGSLEEDAGNIDNWKKFTFSDYQGEILEGDHFFIHGYAGKIADVIQNCCSRTSQKSKL